MLKKIVSIYELSSQPFFQTSAKLAKKDPKIGQIEKVFLQIQMFSDPFSGIRIVKQNSKRFRMTPE